MRQQKRSSQQVRIIGGKWKGRKLRFSGGASLRPTLGRSRETLFNWLRPYIQDTQCLDLFAGSGILGFEALSQGAAGVVFVEQNPKSVAGLQANVAELGVQHQCRVLKGDGLAYLRRNTSVFDVVFLDPPFSQPQLLVKALQILRDTHAVRHFVYAETRTLTELEHAAQQCGWQIAKQTRAGDTCSALLVPAADLQPCITKANIRGLRAS
jgi:16S rRNA (guanine966-N2)-methyltransferase